MARAGSRGSRAGLLAAVLALLVLLGVPGLAGAAESQDAATQLALKHAPIVVVREQAKPCGTGEPFRPIPPTTVLGQPGVVLLGPAGERVEAPTVADLAGKGSDWYLDYPGNPLDPGCSYEEWADRISAGAQPTLTARIATDPEHPGQLALQYWFFYAYNDWNDKHEGDWEMVQLVFDAATPEEALAMAPTSTAYAQHEGSQVAQWDSDSVVKVGDRPVVYPGQGSHAAYYTQLRWFGKSAAAGFGCDDTLPPGLEVQPVVEVMPSGAPPTTGDFAWLSYEGHWGQQEKSFNNGPTGPIAKTQWASPISWQLEEGRTEAVSLPPVPGPALSRFCDVAQAGSLLFVDFMDTPTEVALVLLVVVVVLILLVRATRWRGARADDPDRERRSGQIVAAAFGWVRRNLRALLPVVALVVITFLVTTGVNRLLLAPRPSADITDVNGELGRWAAALLVLVLTLLVVPLVGWVAASVMTAVHEDVELGQPRGGWTRLRTGLRARGAFVTTMLLVLVVVAGVASVVGAPVAVLALMWFGVAPAAAAIEGLGVRAGLRRSAALAKGRRWRTLLVQALLLFVGLSLPSLVGAVLLLLGLSFLVAGLITLALLGLLLPVGYAGMALQYYDLRREQGAEGAPAVVDVGV